MADFKPMITKPTQEQPQKMLNIRKWAGINELADPSEIEINEWSEAENVQLDQLGAIEKRYGYQNALPASLGTLPINGFTFFNNKLFAAQGTYLYEFDTNEYT